MYNIEKLEGNANFSYWKKQIYNVLVPKDQNMPIKYKGVKPHSVTEEEWETMDEKAKSTILLTIYKKNYYNVETESTAFSIW